MSGITGHAAFHLKHVAHPGGAKATGTRTDRRAILKESMRHLDPKDVARHAQKNSNIVPADAHLNTAFVNDGSGGFRVATNVKEVTSYGDTREARVRRKIAKGQATVNLIVVHLPKTLCVEIENYYPRLTPDGTQRIDSVTGEPVGRSRWVARDRDEALRYFQDAVAFLGDEVIPGGRAGIQGWATNFDETTPHMQLMADPFAADPKAPATVPDALRTEQQQAYGSHREVRAPDGRQVSGRVKLQRHQAQMRERMVARGWPVEAGVSERAGKTFGGTAEFGAALDALAEAQALDDQAGEDLELAVTVSDRNERRSEQLDTRESDITRRSSAAEAEGRAEGWEAGFAEGWAEAEASVRADLVALSLLAEDDPTPVLPRRRAPRVPQNLTPARERHLDFTHQHTR